MYDQHTLKIHRRVRCVCVEAARVTHLRSLSVLLSAAFVLLARTRQGVCAAVTLLAGRHAHSAKGERLTDEDPS